MQGVDVDGVPNTKASAQMLELVRYDVVNAVGTCMQSSREAAVALTELFEGGVYNK